MVTQNIQSKNPMQIAWGFFRGRNLCMHKVAVLVDVGFVSQAFSKLKHEFIAESVYNFARSFVKEQEEELLRIFFYHGEPLDKKDAVLPVSKKYKDFSKTGAYRSNIRFLHELARKDNVAIRKGKTVFRGWILKQEIIDQLSTGTFSRALTDQDFFPNIQQKGVDIKIGLDVAWISEHNDISKIILVTGDSDFVPAMKFARREGVQIIVGSCDEHTPRYENGFMEHTDTWRVSERDSTKHGWNLKA